MKKMQIKKIYFLVLIIILWSPLATASPGLDALTRFFDEVKTFKSYFAQVVLDENLTTVDESSGEVWIARPGKFRWNYSPPAAQQIVGDGEKIYLYDVDLKQVTVRAQKKILGDTPAALLAGDGNLQDNYLVEERGQQGKFVWVNLKSKQADGETHDMRIGFLDGQLTLLELVDNLGQHTRISFIKGDVNQPIDEDVFKFIKPQGVDVIDDR